MEWCFVFFFLEGYSGISKPLFALTSGVNRPQCTKGQKNPLMSQVLSSADWTNAYSEAFRKLKKNVVADVLSREPIVHPSVLDRLTMVPYVAFLEEADGLGPDCMQAAFRLSCDPICHLQHCSLTLASNIGAAVSMHPLIYRKAVSAALEYSLEKDSLPPHAFCLPQLTQ